MKKYFFVILSALFLQGCNKNDDQMAWKGEIRYDGHVYQLKNVYSRNLNEFYSLSQPMNFQSIVVEFLNAQN